MSRENQTGIPCYKKTRERVKEFRDRLGVKSYDEALNRLIDIAEKNKNE